MISHFRYDWERIKSIKHAETSSLLHAMISKCALEPSTRSCIPEVDLPLLSSLEASGHYKMFLFLQHNRNGHALVCFSRSIAWANTDALPKQAQGACMEGRAHGGTTQLLTST
jgi:hypothetical protein